MGSAFRLGEVAFLVSRVTQILSAPGLRSRTSVRPVDVVPGEVPSMWYASK